MAFGKVFFIFTVQARTFSQIADLEIKKISVYKGFHNPQSIELIKTYIYQFGKGSSISKKGPGTGMDGKLFHFLFAFPSKYVRIVFNNKMLKIHDTILAFLIHKFLIYHLAYF
jgi:hypothetical protein